MKFVSSLLTNYKRLLYNYLAAVAAWAAVAAKLIQGLAEPFCGLGWGLLLAAFEVVVGDAVVDFLDGGFERAEAVGDGDVEAAAAVDERGAVAGVIAVDGFGCPAVFASADGVGGAHAHLQAVFLEEVARNLDAIVETVGERAHLASVNV